MVATVQEFPALQATVRGRGLIYGLDIPAAGFAKKVSQQAFAHGLVIELSGGRNQVVKCLPPLTIDEETLREGINIVNQAIAEAHGI